MSKLRSVVIMGAVLFLAACQSAGTVESRPKPATSKDRPVYEGPIFPIDEPIVLRQRPFGLSKSNETVAIYLHHGNEEIFGGSFYKESEVQARQKGTHIEYEAETIRLQQTGGKPLKNKPPKFAYTALINDQGKVLDMKIRGMSGTIAKKFAEVLKASIPGLPDHGVVAGDVLHKIAIDDPIVLRGTSVVKGLSRYKDRPVMVVDIDLSSLPNKEDGEATNSYGFGLMDLYTAQWIYSEMKELKTSHELGNAVFIEDTVTRMELAPNTPVGMN